METDDIIHIEKLISDLALKSKVENEVEDDKQFIKTVQKNWLQHSEQYTGLLSDYIKNNKRTLKAKQKYKCVFFVVSCLILLVSLVVCVCVTLRVLNEDGATVDKILQLLPAVITFLAPLFVLPHTIVKYLFNTVDEKNLIKIVEKIIENDKHSLEQ